MSTTNKILFTVCILFVLLHIWAAFYPSYENWGFHFFTLYDPIFSITVLIIAVIFFVPSVNGKISDKLERLVLKLSKRRFIISLLVVVLVFLLLIYLFPARLHLLGDGALLLRVISGLQISGEPPPAFDHQPLVALIFETLKGASQSMGLLDAENLFRSIDAIAGIAFIIMIFSFLRTLQLKPIDKTILGSFIFFSGGSQFFFGYVELYVFLFVFTLCYLTTAWLSLERRMHIIIPALCFGIMMSLHFASVVLVPSMLILFYGVWRERKWEAIVTGGIFLIAGIGIAIAKQIDFGLIITRITKEYTHNMLPLTTTDINFVNPMLSFNHLLDWLNANILIVPFSLILTIILLISNRKTVQWKKPLTLFLLTAASCGVLFTFIMSTGLGMARDWDFLSSFYTPLLVLNIYLLIPIVQNNSARFTTILILSLTILHWAAWIGTNSNEGRHLERYKLLGNPRFTGHVARLNYYETIAALYYSHNDFPKALNYFRDYAELDSNNTRILGNMSEVYKKLGDEEEQFQTLKRVVFLNSPNPSVYMNLGVLYAHRGDTINAIALNEHAVQMDSTHAKAHANLGILYYLKGDYQAAAAHYAKAINYGLHEPFLYRDLASTFFFLGQPKNALLWYDTYLKLVPSDAKVRSIRDQLEALTKKQE